MRWVLMLFVILAAVMGGEARAVVVTGRAVVSEWDGRAETVEKWAETVEKECASFPGATRGMVREAEVAAGLEDAGPLACWFPGGLAVARSDCDAAPDEALEWDGENRLTGIWRGPWKEELAQVPFESLVGEAVAGSTVWRWGYDHRSRRVQRDEPGSGGERLRTVTVFAGGTSAAEYTVTAAAGSAWTVPPAPTVQHVRGPDLGGGTKGLLYSLRNGLPTFNRYNGRGDVVAQSDIDGTTTWAASYQADGRRTAEAGTNVERQRACTKEEDSTGLLNEGFRYRDMETGTFISRDPLGLVDGPNVYCYVRQNPWTMWDPEGLTGWAIPPQYAESAEYREGFRKGMAGGAKVGLALTAGAVATVVAAPAIATGAAAVGVTGGTATAATVLGSGAAGGYASNAISNVLNGREINENWKTATATGALLYGAGHVVGTSVQALKAGLNSVKSTAPSVGGTAAQTTAEVTAATKGGVNIDTGTAIAFVSEGSAVRHQLKAFVAGKEMQMTQTALGEFQGSLRSAGPLEAARGQRFLNRVSIIPDNPSARAMGLNITKKVGANDRIIFGTGDNLSIPTMTSDAKFLRGASAQGVDFDAFLHSPVPFTGR
jgi:RHS repeat-associated protein